MDPERGRYQKTVVDRSSKLMEKDSSSSSLEAEEDGFERFSEIPGVPWVKNTCADLYSRSPQLIKSSSERLYKMVGDVNPTVAVTACLLLGSMFFNKRSSDESTESETSGKMMKAPGRSGVIIKRDVFEDDPKDYFRKLHGKGKL